MNNRNQVWLKRFYVCIVAWTFLSPMGYDIFPRINSSLGPLGFTLLGISVLIVPLFYFVFASGRSSKGKAYAKKNLAIAIILTPIFGLGFLLWPPLVYSEVRRAQPVAGGNAVR